VPCSNPSVGKATDEAPTPASPHSPQRSPMPVIPEFNPPLLDFPLSISEARPVMLLVGERLSTAAPSDPAPPPAQPLHAGGAQVRVYSRRRRRVRSPAPAYPAVADAPSLGSGAKSRLQNLDKVRKPVDRLVPLPVIQKRRKKAAPPGSLPHSRRVAGASPCSPRPVLSVAQMRVMRQLGFEEREIIQPEAQDIYSKLFGPLLSDSHVCALATCFSCYFWLGSGNG